MNEHITITTSIAYPNSNPHLGFTQELLIGDFLARYARRFLDGKVHLQTGTDEHGKKVFLAAQASGMDTLAFVTKNAEVFKKLADTLDISYTRFFRTTDSDHYEVASALWKKAFKNGYLEKRQYQAWYDIKEEEFLGTVEQFPDPSVFSTDSKFIEKIDETNWFFKFSAFTESITRLITTNAYRIYPEERRREMLQFLERGLEDVSVSREKSELPWGIPVPGDDTQVMYVWFDALTNYLTGVASVVDGEITPNTFWPIHTHVVGKDISRFHALLWPAMLLAAGFSELDLPRRLLVHGFVLAADGTKMSKSIGNVVDPFTELDATSVSALRWFLLREIPTLADGPAGRERIGTAYRRDLANGYGNLVSRVFSMVHKYRDGVVPQVEIPDAGAFEREVVSASEAAYHEAVSECRIDTALEAALKAVTAADERIERMAPWKMAKDESKQQELDELLYELLELCYHVGSLLIPALPELESWLDETFPVQKGLDYRKLSWGVVTAGVVLPVITPLFPRIESDVQ